MLHHVGVCVCSCACLYVRSAVVHNDMTHHFGKLLVHLVEILRATPAAPTETPLLAINALYFTRVIIKYFTEHTTGEQMHRLLGHPSAAANAAASNALLSTVIETVFMYLIESAPTCAPLPLPCPSRETVALGTCTL